MSTSGQEVVALLMQRQAELQQRLADAEGEMLAALPMLTRLRDAYGLAISAIQQVQACERAALQSRLLGAAAQRQEPGKVEP